eukprot:SAG11_NODE_1705_length_4412_cov_5.951078_1_plen_325_part_10
MQCWRVSTTEEGVKGELRKGVTQVLRIEDMRYVEPWSLIQLRLLDRDMPPDTAEQCIVKRSQTSDFSERLEEFCVVGLTEIKAAAQASTLYVTMRGKTRVGQCALMTAIKAAHRPKKRPLAERAWEKQGGPRPRWSRLFGALHGMTMAPWIRAAAWQTLEGAIQWGEDRLDWSPTTSLCHFCTQKQKYSVESAVHFAIMMCECTRYGYGSIRVQRVRVQQVRALPVQAHKRSSGLNLRVSTGGRNVHRGTRSTSTEVLVLPGSGVTYPATKVLCSRKASQNEGGWLTRRVWVIVSFRGLFNTSNLHGTAVPRYCNNAKFQRYFDT